jgi:hypothetical protein
MLKRARDKYKPDNTTLTGHSLGGSIVQYLGKKGDNVLSLDSGYTLGQKTRGTSYRTSGDIVSLLGSGATHQHTLKNNNLIQSGLAGAYYSHDVSNIKNSGIFV